MSINHLRVTAAPSDAPIPVDEAVGQAREQFRQARNAYVDLLEVFGCSWLRSLLRSEEKVTVTRLRITRDEAQRMAEKALTVVSALDACLDTCERAERVNR